MHKKVLKELDKDISSTKHTKPKNYKKQEKILDKAHTKIHKLRDR